MSEDIKTIQREAEKLKVTYENMSSAERIAIVSMVSTLIAARSIYEPEGDIHDKKLDKDSNNVVTV